MINLAPGSFSWQAAAAALTDGPVPQTGESQADHDRRTPRQGRPDDPNDGPGAEQGLRRGVAEFGAFMRTGLGTGRP
jgi:hypothetical protein